MNSITSETLFGVFQLLIKLSSQGPFLSHPHKLYGPNNVPTSYKINTFTTFHIVYAPLIVAPPFSSVSHSLIHT